MRLDPAAACFFAQRYKGGEYLLPRSLAMGNRAGLLLANHTPVQIYVPRHGFSWERGMFSGALFRGNWHVGYGVI
jgi:hypothetical protein